MANLYTIQPEDREPIEFTHFACWDKGTTWSDIVRAWNVTFGNSLFEIDNSDVTIMQLLRQGYDVYEGDEFIEIYASEEIENEKI